MKERHNKCLCCGQVHLGYKKSEPLTQPELEINFTLLEQLGYTREALLTRHADQLDFQLPGMREWLRGQ